MEKSGFVFIVIAAVAVLIGLAFYSSISGNIGTMTRTVTAVNSSFTMPAYGSISELTQCGQKVTSVLIINATGGEVVTSTNYSTSQSVGTDGFLAAKINTTAARYGAKAVNLTCTYEPKGYIEDGAGRSVVVLIGIFFALLIAISAIPDLRNGVIDWFKG